MSFVWFQRATQEAFALSAWFLDSLWRAFSFCISQVRVALNMQCVGAARLLPLASWVGRAPARRAQAHYFKSDRNGFSSDM